jgi:PAS domain-containing protein
MNENKPTYEELEKKLADDEALIASLRGEVEAAKSVRDTALPRTRELEEAYIESEQNFRNSLDASPLGVRIVTENGELLTVSY